MYFILFWFNWKDFLESSIFSLESRIDIHIIHLAYLLHWKINPNFVSFFVLECIHGGILKNAVFEDLENTNKTIIKHVLSMYDCVDTCCNIKDCDVAMMNSKKCYVVNCATQGSCQVKHIKREINVQSEMAFILSKVIPGKVRFRVLIGQMFVSISFCNLISKLSCLLRF